MDFFFILIYLLKIIIFNTNTCYQKNIIGYNLTIGINSGKYKMTIDHSHTTNTMTGMEYHPAFYQGLEHFSSENFSAALNAFSQALKSVSSSSSYYNKYLSFVGLSSVLTGDRSGLNLCRRAAKDEHFDGDVFCNLVHAELKLGHRKQAVQAMQKGFSVDAEHIPLIELQEYIGERRPPIIPFLPRDNFLNRFLGKISYKKTTKE